jgi:DNA-binding transcriptional ArsR family regulator
MGQVAGSPRSGANEKSPPGFEPRGQPRSSGRTSEGAATIHRALDTELYIDIFGNMETTSALAALGALAQESRLAVFRTLVQAGPAGLPAGVIADRLGLPRPTLSFHLAQLKGAGLVQYRREGRSLIYAADYATTNGLISYLLENCCQSDASCVAPSCAASAKLPRSPQLHREGVQDETSARARRRR